MKKRADTFEDSKREWPLPDWESNPADWFSEHDVMLGDGYEYERGALNQVVGVRVDGRQYQQFI